MTYQLNLSDRALLIQINAKPNSLCISCMVSNFCATEIEICLVLGQLVQLKKKVWPDMSYEHLLRAIFSGAKEILFLNSDVVTCTKALHDISFIKKKIILFLLYWLKIGCRHIINCGLLQWR